MLKVKLFIGIACHSLRLGEGVRLVMYKLAGEDFQAGQVRKV
jgi:hypothetical protein